MSSQEVIKHSRKILGVMKDGKTGWKHKLSEVFVEILIIVFAISLSLLLERWRQKEEDRHLEKKFLLGLKTDLGSDIEALKQSTVKWRSRQMAANSLLNPAVPADSIRYYVGFLFHNVYFFPSTNRYESIKSTGKLDVIENDELQNDIIDLYQTKIPDLIQQINFFNDFMNNQTKNYLIHNLKRDEKNEFIIDKAFIGTTEIKNILFFCSDLNDVARRADTTIAAGEKILKEIDARFKN